MKSDILVMIPAYNEEANIKNVIEYLKENYSDLDYIIVNDGSSDKTKEICEKEGYHALHLAANLGLAGAFQTGMRYAYLHNYTYAVQLDGDGQHRPEYIYTMRDRMKQGYDIVIASRYIHIKKPWSPRMLGSRFITMAIILMTGKKVADPTSGMRMYNREMIKEFALRLNYGPEPDTISYLIKQGAKVSEIPAIMDERVGGVSYLTPINAMRYMFRMLISIFLIQNFRKR